MRCQICRSKPRLNAVLKVRYFFWRCGLSGRPVAFKAAHQFSADIRLFREQTFSDHQLGKLADGTECASVSAGQMSR